MSHTAESNTSVLIKPDTDVVASQVDTLRATLCAAIDQGATHIVIDLEAVEMVDALGLGVLIATHNTLHEHGGSLLVVNISTALLRLFELMRLDKHFAVTAREMA
jgi:anti-anti-sigma factor